MMTIFNEIAHTLNWLNVPEIQHRISIPLRSFLLPFLFNPTLTVVFVVAMSLYVAGEIIGNTNKALANALSVALAVMSIVIALSFGSNVMQRTTGLYGDELALFGQSFTYICMYTCICFIAIQNILKSQSKIKYICLPLIAYSCVTIISLAYSVANFD